MIRHVCVMLAITLPGCNRAALEPAPSSGGDGTSDFASQLDSAAPCDEFGASFCALDPSCKAPAFMPRCGVPFPLPTDDTKDPRVANVGVVRGFDGALDLIQSGTGVWSYVFEGCDYQCGSQPGRFGDTIWLYVEWRAELLADAKVNVRVRSGQTAVPDSSWGTWISYSSSPADLAPLMPNWTKDGHMQVEITLTAKTLGHARLVALRATHNCGYCPG